MPQNRIIYQNWIVEIGADPKKIKKSSNFENNVNNNPDNIIKEVNSALAKLDVDEREFIIRFYYMGETYNRIAEISNRSIHKLNAFHQQILKKLNNYLKNFVNGKFNIDINEESLCPICRSEYKPEIDKLIKSRDKRKTWKPLKDLIEKKYHVKFRTPQVLIGHEKYHITD